MKYLYLEISMLLGIEIKILTFCFKFSRFRDIIKAR